MTPPSARSRSQPAPGHVQSVGSAGRLAVLVVAMAAVGWAVGFLMGRASRERAAESSASGAPAARAEAISARVVPPPSAAAAEPDAPRPAASAETWAALRQQPPSRERDRAMKELMRSLGATAPATAVELLREEPNLVLRRQLRAAMLTGWIGTDPDAAAAWALGETASERYGAVNDVLRAAADRPELAVRLAATATERDPERAGDYGRALTSVLADAGACELAAEFAITRPSLQVELLVPAFYEWAQRDPSAALAALTRIPNPAATAEAYRAIVQGWSVANPAAATEYAQQLGPGPGRAAAFEEALPRWVEYDPNGAAAWLDSRGDLAEYDPGRVALATHPELLGRRPDAAAAAAARITNPELRRDTLSAVVREWWRRDSVAARQFVQASPLIQDAQRAALLADASSSVGP